MREIIVNKFFISSIFLFSISIIGCVSLAEQDGHWLYPNKIKAYIPPNHKRTVMMKHAFAEWTRLTNKKILFYYVSSPAKADLKVSFVKSIPNADRQIGLTKSLVLSNGKITSSEILIAEKTTDGRQLGNDAVYTVMLHEIGHAIGLMEHSKNPLSIMYATEDDRQEILKSDLQRLNKIYGWK